MLWVDDSITIEEWELVEQFTQSGGPGGQNVNKVATAVELRFEASRSPNLPGPVKSRLRHLAGRRWTREGAILIQVAETRHQSRNRQIARDRLVQLIREAAQRPKKRIPTKPTMGSKRRRLEAKRARGDIKALRGKISRDQS